MQGIIVFTDAPWRCLVHAWGSLSRWTALMCFPSGKSVVTFLILLDWKNIANMVWSGKSFDAGTLQINLWMPYGLHSSLNLFPINVYWIFCRSQHVCNQTWKTEGRGEQFVAKCDYYDLSFYFFFLHDRWVARPIQNKQTRKHANNSPLRRADPGSPRHARSGTKKTPLKEQLKSNDCKLRDDSSTDRLFPMKLDIGLPLTEKSTDSRRPAVEDMEVSFSKRSRLSYGGFQHSEDITCFLCWADNREPNICHQKLPVWVSALQNTQHFVPFIMLWSICKKNTQKKKNIKEQTCQTFISQLQSTVN